MRWDSFLDVVFVLIGNVAICDRAGLPPSISSGKDGFHSTGMLPQASLSAAQFRIIRYMDGGVSAPAQGWRRIVHVERNNIILLLSGQKNLEKNWVSNVDATDLFRRAGGLSCYGFGNITSSCQGNALWQLRPVLAEV